MSREDIAIGALVLLVVVPFGLMILGLIWYMFIDVACEGYRKLKPFLAKLRGQSLKDKVEQQRLDILSAEHEIRMLRFDLRDVSNQLDKNANFDVATRLRVEELEKKGRRK